MEQENNKNENNQPHCECKAWAGVTFAIIITAVVAGGMVYIVMKEKNRNEVLSEVENVRNEMQIKIAELEDQIDILKSNGSETSQPKMPTASDLSNKTPEQLVKEFYEWYIGSVNYRYHQIFQLKEKKPINISELIEKSPFIGSGYLRNIENKKGKYDLVLCTNDNQNNIVKEYGDAKITGNLAEVEIKRGWTQIEDIQRIQIRLIKEENQWKINDIFCIN